MKCLYDRFEHGEEFIVGECYCIFCDEQVTPNKNGSCPHCYSSLFEDKQETKENKDK